jgi:Flp pilus assembly protein TadD
MTEAPQDSVRVILDAFRAFVGNAAEEQKQGNRAARDIWLSAANHLIATTDASVGSVLQHLLHQGQYADAEAIAHAFARLQPESVSAHFNLGFVMQMANRHSEAVAPYRTALAIDPAFHSLRNNLAGALMQADPASDEASALLEAAIKQAPEDINSWINLSMSCSARNQIDRALEAGERALSNDPQNTLALSAHAHNLREAQRWDDAERCARKAVALAPDSVRNRLNLGMLLLLRGKFAEGWPLHELRWEGSSELEGKRPRFTAPQWAGQPLIGKTVLLWGEQGMGDLLQFCRYVPLLAEEVHRRGGRLAWNSFPQMGALLRRSLAHHADAFSLDASIEKLPAHDFEFPMASLPLLFQTREDTVPAAPYLHADPEALGLWRKRLGGERRLKVGITWTGSHEHKRNPFRRVGIERYVQYFRGLDGVAFYSLQPGAEDDVAQARAAGFNIADYTKELKTFDDTAAFVGALDLVVSVCTSVAHLSGALGQRTWVLLDVNPHWVWLLERTDSPWYPATTLYRQKQFGEWAPALDALTSDLVALASTY